MFCGSSLELFSRPLNNLRSLQLSSEEPLFRFEDLRSFPRVGIVYGLCGIDRKIFYIGMTINPSRRFSSRERYPSNLVVMKRMKECGYDLRVVVIASKSLMNRAKAQKSLLAMERDLIMFHGRALLNRAENSFHDGANCSGNFLAQKDFTISSLREI